MDSEKLAEHLKETQDKTAVGARKKASHYCEIDRCFEWGDHTLVLGLHSVRLCIPHRREIDLAPKTRSFAELSAQLSSQIDIAYVVMLGDAIAGRLVGAATSKFAELRGQRFSLELAMIEYIVAWATAPRPAPEAP